MNNIYFISLKLATLLAKTNKNSLCILTNKNVCVFVGSIIAYQLDRTLSNALCSSSGTYVRRYAVRAMTLSTRQAGKR